MKMLSFDLSFRARPRKLISYAKWDLKSAAYISWYNPVGISCPIPHRAPVMDLGLNEMLKVRTPANFSSITIPRYFSLAHFRYLYAIDRYCLGFVILNGIWSSNSTSFIIFIGGLEIDVTTFCHIDVEEFGSHKSQVLVICWLSDTLLLF